MGWVGKDCWLVIKQYIVFDNWYIPVAQWVDPDTLANNIGKPEFWFHLQCFLWIQEQLEFGPDTNSSQFFYILDKIHVHLSALTTFYAASDLCGTGGMHHKYIHTITFWRYNESRYNCVFINTNKLAPCMLGLNVAWVKLFFFVTLNCAKYSCALVHWYSLVGDSPKRNTSI